MFSIRKLGNALYWEGVGQRSVYSYCYLHPPCTHGELEENPRTGGNGFLMRKFTKEQVEKPQENVNHDVTTLTQTDEFAGTAKDGRTSRSGVMRTSYDYAPVGSPPKSAMCSTLTTKPVATACQSCVELTVDPNRHITVSKWNSCPEHEPGVMQ